MKKLIPLIAILIISTSLCAQSIQDTSKTDPSLKGQYEFMLSKSKTLNGYKLVNPARLSTFWKSIKDTIAISRQSVIKANKKIIEQDQQIKGLNNQITGNETSLASSNAKVNEIQFLGMAFTKSSYNMIVWTIIIVLAITLAVVIIRSGKLIHEAKYRTSLYEEISQEYQNYKVKANEKEKKLARELQDERNAIEELKNRQ